MRKRVLNFSDEIDSKLQELKLELEMPINKIITMIINEKLEDLKILKKDYVEDLDLKGNQNESAIFFRIKENEKIFLEQQVKKTGTNSLTNEIRYRLLNSIYKNKYFLPFEIKEIQKLISNIGKTGINLNQISRKLNLNKELNKNDFMILNNSINELKEEINSVKKELNNIIETVKNRD